MPILGWRWPWEAIAETVTKPEKIIEAIIEEPAITPITGVISGVKKLALPLAFGAGGFLLSRLLGGGAAPQDITQEIDQTPTVIPTVIPTVTPTVIPIVVPTITPTITPTIAPTVAPEISVIDSVIHGGIGTTVIHETMETHETIIQPTITKTITETITKTVTPTLTYTFAGQEATQKQGLDLFTIALIGAIGLGAYWILKKEKRAS